MAATRKTLSPRRPAATRKLRIHGTIAHRLGVQIVGGHYQPGDVLAKEVVASKRLKVSRTAYREAIRILAAKGLLESQPKAGTRVSARSHWQLLDSDVLQWVFMGKADDRLIQGLFELRMIVEPAAAALAATRRNKAQLAQMREALDRMETFGLEAEAGQVADCEFHSALLAATGNEVLASLASGITAAVRWTTVYKARFKLVRDTTPLHVRVYEAINAGEAESARTIMAELVRISLEDTRRAGSRVHT